MAIPGESQTQICHGDRGTLVRARVRLREEKQSGKGEGL